MKKTLFTLALLAATSVVGAKTLATVDDSKIDSKLIDEQVKMISTQSKGQVKDTPQLRKSILTRAVVHTVIVNEARRLKLNETAEYKNIVAQAQADADKTGESKKSTFKKDFASFQENLLEQAYAAYVLQQNPVSEKDVKALHDDISKFYKGSKEVQLAEIAVKSESEAQAVLSELKTGKKFADLVQKYSIDEAAKKNNGVNGFINLKDMEVGAPKLYAAVKDLKKGQYTQQPLVAGDVAVVFMVHDLRDSKVPEFSKMKDMLTAQLNDRRVSQSIDALIKKAKIKINE